MQCEEDFIRLISRFSHNCNCTRETRDRGDGVYGGARAARNDVPPPHQYLIFSNSNTREHVDKSFSCSPHRDWRAAAGVVKGTHWRASDSWEDAFILSSSPLHLFPPPPFSHTKKSGVCHIDFSPRLETFDKKKPHTDIGRHVWCKSERVEREKNPSDLKRVKVFPLWAIFKVFEGVWEGSSGKDTHTHTHTPEWQVNVSYIWSYWKGLWKAFGSLFFFFLTSYSTLTGKTAKSLHVFQAKL